MMQEVNTHVTYMYSSAEYHTGLRTLSASPDGQVLSWGGMFLTDSDICIE
jgi:hypothetical protein